MGFEQGLSGLAAASNNLDVIGNNVSNANTVGFKGSTAEFADLYAGSVAGASSTGIGIGTTVAAVAQQFSQGAVQTTNNPLDMAINGQGFFQLQQNGTNVFSRNGQFSLDNQGYIVNSSGAKLTGFAAGTNGVLPSATPTPLQISTADIPPNTTSKVTANLNLDSASTALNAANFNPADSSTYTYATSVNVYDSLGNSHAMSMYFVQTGPNASGQNVWKVFATNDGSLVGGSPATPVASLTFASNGSIDTAATTNPTSVSVPVASGATTPLTFSLDFTGTTQFGSTSSVNALSQNGYTSGSLTNYTISSTGVIQGSYSNGQTQTLGQVALANFAAPEGLQPLGNNEWTQSFKSGPALVGAPNSGSLGTIQSGAVESSNVDLTTELVNMLTAQRTYQANAQTIKTEDTIMNTLVNLG